MMKKNAKVIIKDERTEKLDRQIASEIVLGVVILLLVSVFVKVYFLQLALMAYLPELLLVIGIGFYSLIRRMDVGVDVRDMLDLNEKWYHRSGEALIFMVVITIINVVAQRESLSSLVTITYLYKVLFGLFLFVVIGYAFDKLVMSINAKRQEKLEQELEGEE